MSKSLKIALGVLMLASSNAFAAYGDHAILRGQTPGSAPEPSASAGSSVFKGGTISPSMADFFRWNDLGSLNISAS